MESNRTVSEIEAVAETAGYAFLFALAISGNLLVSCALLRRGQLDTPSNRLVFSLTTSHFILLILLVPSVFVSVWRNKVFFNETWCTISAFVTVLVLVAGSLTLASISMDRFVAIVHPMKYGTVVTSIRISVLLLAVWIVGCCCAILPLVGVSRFKYRDGLHTCWISWSASYVYTGVLFVISVLLPLFTMLGAYLRILRIARKKCRKIIVGSFTTPPKTILSERKGSNVGDMYKSSSSPSDPVGQSGDGPGTKRPHQGVTEFKTGPEYEVSDVLQRDRLQTDLDETTQPVVQGTYSECPFQVNITPNISSVTNPIDDYLLTQILNGRTSSDTPSYVNSALDNSQIEYHQFSNEMQTRGGASFHLGESNAPGCSNQQIRMNSIGEKLFESSDKHRPSVGKLSQIRHKMSLTSTRKASWGTVVTHSSPTKGIWTIFFVFGGFLLTWMTLIIIAIWEVFSSSEEVPSALEGVSLATIIAGSATHPVLYGLYDRSIRKHLKMLFCVRRRRNRCQSLRRGSAKWSDISDCTYSHHSRDGSGLGWNKNATSLTSVPSTSTGWNGTPRESSNSVVRKPSQDSGAVLPSDTEDHSDPADRKPKILRKYNRRMSAPPELILQTRQREYNQQSLLSESIPECSPNHECSPANHPLRYCSPPRAYRTVSPRDDLVKYHSLESVHLHPCERVVQLEDEGIEHDSTFL